MYGERGAFEALLARFVGLAQHIRVGDPASEQTDMGPLVSAAQLGRVEALVRTARAQGHFALGGERAHIPGMENGYFFQPTIITAVPDDAAVIPHEIFGPPVVLLPFDPDH